MQTKELIVDKPENEFLVHRDVYRDKQVFEWELKYIFEASWNLIGIEAQIPKPFDYFTTYIGRMPVIISRDGRGNLHCVMNSCRHKGPLVCHAQSGNSRNFVCQYHGWAFDTSGKNILIKNKEQGAYPSCFDSMCHDLQPVARFASYRGMLFASLNPEVPELDDYLGDYKAMIDLVVDQGPDGVECVPGTGVFTFKANWKFQMENGVDPYHFSSTHPSYIQALKKRTTDRSVYTNFKSSDLERGTFSFGNGHNAMWGPAPEGKVSPLGLTYDELEKRVGAIRAKWMTYVRNTTFFPNAQISDNASLQLRIWRPLAPDLTEMRTFCLAPKGEPAEARRLRIRQYEEFFNPTGLATPDDIANYEDGQRGMQALNIHWQQGHARGSMMQSKGVVQSAQELGIEPKSAVIGGFDLGDETIMHETYRYWNALIQKGLQHDSLTGGKNDK